MGERRLKNSDTTYWNILELEREVGIIQTHEVRVRMKIFGDVRNTLKITVVNMNM